MAFFYIHSTACTFPQDDAFIENEASLRKPIENKLETRDLEYEGIPSGVLRRMGKAVKMGVGTGLKVLKGKTVDGIILGTSDGGMEDCIKFLNQLMDYDEGILTPGSFVQSTPNAIAAQIGLITHNKCYNITHVHGGLSFENAILDTAMMLRENTESCYLLGGVDEISTYNYNMDRLAGWYREPAFSGAGLYESDGSGSVAGEGAAMFVASAQKECAIAQVDAIHLFHAQNDSEIEKQTSVFIGKYLPESKTIDLLLSGENGDSRFTHFYTACERQMDVDCTVARYKHLTGEYATSSAMALWLAIEIIQNQYLPAHMVKRAGTSTCFNTVLIYNNFRNGQHSLMLVSRP